MSNKRGVYEIRFRELSKGRDGGLGPTKSFLATLSSPKLASKKIRCRAVITSVVKAR